MAAHLIIMLSCLCCTQWSCSSIIAGDDQAAANEADAGDVVEEEVDAAPIDDDLCLDENKIAFFVDSDSDGFGDTLESLQACEAPAGFVDNSDDCDDTSDAVNPLAVELCGDQIDNDCDASEPCQDVLISDLGFEGTGSGSLDDRSGNGLNALLRNGAVTTGNSLALDGIDDYAEVLHDASFALTSGTVSLVALSNTSGVPQGLWSKDSNLFDDGGHLLIEFAADDSVSVRLQDTVASHVATSLPVSRDAFHHIALSFGTGGMRLYVDGVLVATNPFSGGIAANTEDIALGTSTIFSGDGVNTPITDPTSGEIASVRMYSRELSAAEITELSVLQTP